MKQEIYTVKTNDRDETQKSKQMMEILMMRVNVTRKMTVVDDAGNR